MKKFGPKLFLSRATVRVVATDNLSLAEGGAESQSCITVCSHGCGNWDSDVVKLREGGGGKESK